MPFPGPSSSGDQALGEHRPPSGGGGVLSPPPSQPLGFLGVQQVHFLRCAVCLFWWLKSWLAKKPACSLVEDASQRLQLPLFGFGCPCLPVSSRGWASLQPASFAEFLCCVSGPGSVLGYSFSPGSSLSLSFFLFFFFLSLSGYPTVWAGISC